MADGLVDPDLRAWRGFLRAHAGLWKGLESDLSRRTGLSPSAYDVLVLLESAEPEGCRMSELASAVLMSSGGLTRLADRLERDGLIRRQPSARDGRGAEAVLTDRGREVLAQARRVHLEQVRARFLDHLDDEEKRLLGQIWERLLHAEAERTERPTAGRLA